MIWKITQYKFTTTFIVVNIQTFSPMEQIALEFCSGHCGRRNDYKSLSFNLEFIKPPPHFTILSVAINFIMWLASFTLACIFSEKMVSKANFICII